MGWASGFALSLTQRVGSSLPFVCELHPHRPELSIRNRSPLPLVQVFAPELPRKVGGGLSNQRAKAAGERPVELGQRQHARLVVLELAVESVVPQPTACSFVQMLDHKLQQHQPAAGANHGVQARHRPPRIGDVVKRAHRDGGVERVGCLKLLQGCSLEGLLVRCIGIDTGRSNPAEIRWRVSEPSPQPISSTSAGATGSQCSMNSSRSLVKWVNAGRGYVRRA